MLVVLLTSGRPKKEERERERDRDGDRENERERDRQTDRQTDRQAGRQRRERQTDRQTDKDTETQTQTQKERERVSARSFPLTLAYPRQYIHRNLRRWMPTVLILMSVQLGLNTRDTGRVSIASYLKQRKGKNEEKEKKIKKGGVEGKRLPSMP